jgi:hypothetical protein
VRIGAQESVLKCVFCVFLIPNNAENLPLRVGGIPPTQFHKCLLISALRGGDQIILRGFGAAARVIVKAHSRQQPRAMVIADFRPPFRRILFYEYSSRRKGVLTSIVGTDTHFSFPLRPAWATAQRLGVDDCRSHRFALLDCRPDLAPRLRLEVTCLEAMRNHGSNNVREHK